jgi:hypothetical protein
MTYSKTHQNFANHLNKPEALTNPENFLGPNYETVLNFWKWIDSLSVEQWKVVADRYCNLDDAARSAAWDAARYAARDAAGSAAGSAAWNAAWSAAGSAAWDAAGSAAWSAARDVARVAAWNAAGYATYELIGMHILLEQGKKLLFVPLFDGL